MPEKMSLVSMVCRSKPIQTILFCLLLTNLVAQEENFFEVSATKYLLGTEVQIKAMHPSITECKKAFVDAFEEIDRIENLLSMHKQSSEILKINPLGILSF